MYHQSSKKYIDDYVSPWKFFLDHYLGEIGGRFVLKCQFDTRKLPVALPVFYKDCFDAWSFLVKRNVATYEDVMNQVIWNNKNILSQGKSIYQQLFRNCSIVKVGDLVSKDRSFLKSEKVIRARLSPSQLFSLMGIVNAIPGEWRSIIKENTFTDPHPFNENTFLLPVKGEIVDLLSTSSKTLYKEFCSHKATTPTAQARLNTEYPNLSVEWKKIYSLSFNATLDMKLRIFQYKILNHILYTNSKLFAFKIVDSPLCTFCKKEEESLEHLLFYCKIVDLFWKEVLSWIAIYKDEVVEISLIDILFGKFDIDKDFKAIIYIYIYYYWRNFIFTDVSWIKSIYPLMFL